MTRLMGLKFRIVYRQGKDNIVADSLSRVGHMMALQAVSEVQPVWLQEVLNSYATDPKAQQLLAQLAIHSPDASGFSLHQNLIRHQGKVWIGDNSALQTKLIAAFHSSAIGGHSGTKATYHRLKNLFAWKGMKQDVDNFIKQCSICQQAKHINALPAGLLAPLPIPDGAWEQISMDFIEGLPKSDGYSSILVVVDRFMKYAHFIPLKHPFTAAHIAKVVLDNVVKLHGLPLSIVTDRDKIFISGFWKELFKLYNINLQLSTTYHPQTDGQTERVNQCLEMFLRCAVYDSPKQWHSWLSLAELWYNSSFHTSLNCSPFKALYGYDARVGAITTIPEQASSSVSEFATTRQLHLDSLKAHLSTAQNRMKLQADKHQVDRQFTVGDQVLLKPQPYAQSSVVNRPFPKLAFKYFGPYQVLERLGPAAYRLALPEGSLVHPVFHISQLKPFTPDYTPVYTQLPLLADLSATELEPESVLDRRLVKKGNRAIPQVLVKRANIPQASAT